MRAKHAATVSVSAAEQISLLPHPSVEVNFFTIFNLLFLYSFGRDCEQELGRRRYFAFIALLVAIQIGLDSVSTSYTDLVALQAGKADLLITAHGGHLFKPEPFDPAVVRSKLAKHPEVRGLAPRWVGIVQIQSNRGSQDALLIGVDPKAEHEFDLWGLKPEPKLSGKACAVSHALAQRLKAKLGGQLSVSSSDYANGTALEVETIVDRQLILPQEVREFIVVNDATARAILGEPDRVHVLAGTFKEPGSYYDSRDLHASVLRLKRAGESIAAELTRYLRDRERNGDDEPPRQPPAA